MKKLAGLLIVGIVCVLLILYLLRLNFLQVRNETKSILEQRELNIIATAYHERVGTATP